MDPLALPTTIAHCQRFSQTSSQSRGFLAAKPDTGTSFPVGASMPQPATAAVSQEQRALTVPTLFINGNYCGWRTCSGQLAIYKDKKRSYFWFQRKDFGWLFVFGLFCDFAYSAHWRKHLWNMTCISYNSSQLVYTQRFKIWALHLSSPQLNSIKQRRIPWLKI